jgi:ABC-type transporter Mla maintaining outer membrane lipid asymmetry ATPase subunit MlaF
MQLGAQIAKVTVEEIRKALEKLIAELKADLKKTPVTVTHGKQSLKELAAQNAGLSSLTVK